MLGRRPLRLMCLDKRNPTWPLVRIAPVALPPLARWTHVRPALYPLGETPAHEPSRHDRDFAAADPDGRHTPTLALDHATRAGSACERIAASHGGGPSTGA